MHGGADYGQWVTFLKGLVPNPQAFLVPGFNVLTGGTPSVVDSSLSQLESSYPDLDGGFIWQYENIIKAGYTAAQYAAAIVSGLGSGKSQGAAT